MSATNQDTMPAPPHPSVSASLCALARSGLRTILVTRTLEDDSNPAFRSAVLSHESRPGSSSYPGGFVGAAAVALAESGHRVLIVQAGPSQPGPRGPQARRGLWELLHEVYLCNLTAERTAQFGLGDWLEILYAQGRTGELLVHEGEESFLVRLAQGSIRAFHCRLEGGEARIPERELRARVSVGIVRMVGVKSPEFQFRETGPPESAPAEATRHGLDEVLRDRLRGHLRHPYLEKQIAEHLLDTAQPDLKMLTAGAGGFIRRSLRRPLERLMDRLGRSFGVVLIDAPPVSSLGPTAALAGLADGALVVASLAGVRSVGLLHTVDELRRAGVTMVAVHAVRIGTPYTSGREA